MVFAPDFKSGSMVRKNRYYGRIRSKTARVMLTWNHYSFRMLLRSKAAETGALVISVTEGYTSKTRRSYGSVHQTLGSAKVFC